MAHIIPVDAEAKACERVNELLESIKTLNAILTANSPALSISVGKSKKTAAISFTFDSAYNEKLLAIVKLQRSKLIQDTIKLTKKYPTITLNKEEKQAISKSAIESIDSNTESSATDAGRGASEKAEMDEANIGDFSEEDSSDYVGDFSF